MFIGCVSGYTDVQGNDDMGKAMGIETWPPDERPRERLLRYGPETLTDGQLLAILLGTGCEGWTALDVGVALLDRRSEEHTSELQSPCNLVCRLLLEKKKKKKVCC